MIRGWQEDGPLLDFVTARPGAAAGTEALQATLVALGFASRKALSVPPAHLANVICSAIVMAKKGRNSFVKAALARKQDVDLECDTPEQTSKVDPVPVCPAGDAAAASASEHSIEGDRYAAVVQCCWVICCIWHVKGVPCRR